MRLQRALRGPIFGDAGVAALDLGMVVEALY